MTRIAFAVHVNILNRSAVEEFAATLEDASWPDAITVAVCNPARPPLSVGYELVDKRIGETENGVHVVVLSCEVHDPISLVEEARSCYQGCWQEVNWSPVTLDEALYEILVASNDSPSPVDIGFEIRDVVYSDDPVPVPSEAPRPTS